MRDISLPAEVAERFLPAEDYARAMTVDYGRMAEVQAAFAERYRNEAN